MEDSDYLVDSWKKSPFFVVQDEYEFTCTRLLERIEKILANVQLEKLNIESIHNELDNELDEFNEISNELNNKIKSLTSLSHTHYCVNYNLKDFVEDVSSRWQAAINEGNLHYCRVRISTRSILRKIQIDADEIKLMLQFSICNCNQQCIEKGFYIWNEIYRLIEIIANCDHEVQLLMPIRDIAPRINNLISSINNFVNNNEFIRFNSKCEELTVFPYVSKLLTGELIGLKPINPEFVLKTNALRRPIFITRIIRQKVKNRLNICEC